MATAAAIAEYVDDANFAREEIAAQGFRVCFGIKPSDTDYGMAGDFLEIGSAHVLPIPDTKHFVDDIRADDIFFFVTDEFDFDVRRADTEGDFYCIINDREYQVYRAIPLRLDNQTLILTEIQCRH